MPRFLLTITLIAIISLGGLLYILFRVPPTSGLAVYAFIFSMFVFIATTLSIPLYIPLYKNAERFTNLRKIYRTALRRSSWVALGICGLLLLKVLQGLTILTGTLLIFFLIILEIFISSK